MSLGYTRDSMSPRLRHSLIGADKSALRALAASQHPPGPGPRQSRALASPASRADLGEIGQTGADERRRRRDGGAVALGEVVEHGHLVAGLSRTSLVMLPM
jgi:hypothetical protein